MKKKLGRPKKTKAESRSPGISVRLTEDEAGQIQTAVDRSPLKKSDWARKALLYVAKNGVELE